MKIAIRRIDEHWVRIDISETAETALDVVVIDGHRRAGAYEKLLVGIIPENVVYERRGAVLTEGYTTIGPGVVAYRIVFL